MPHKCSDLIHDWSSLNQFVVGCNPHLKVRWSRKSDRKATSRSDSIKRSKTSLAISTASPLPLGIEEVWRARGLNKEPGRASKARIHRACVATQSPQRKY